MKLFAAFSDLSDKSVFISGGGSGIGACLTEGFLAQGAKVAFCQRSDATALCTALNEAYGRQPHFTPCDVTDIPALKQAIDDSQEVNGPIDILVNNAAWDNRHTLAEMDPEQWDHMMNVNLRHHFFAVQAVADTMRRRGGGSIINFSSISYMMGNAGYPAYTSAKAGITGLTRSLARELGGDNIRVNALLPGWTLTERQKKLWATDETVKAHVQRQCLKQTIAPEDIVEPTLFLASDASRMITGQALVVDAGVVVTG